MTEKLDRTVVDLGMLVTVYLLYVIFFVYFKKSKITCWYFSSAMLVSAASGVSMKISLFLWIFSRMPWK